MYTWIKTPHDLDSLEEIRDQIEVIKQYQQENYQYVFRSPNNSGEQGKKRTVLLDLDDTLVKTCLNQKLKNRSPNFKISLRKEGTFYVYTRPYVEEFLKELSKHFNIDVFTSADEQYAGVIADKLDKKKRYIRSIYHKAHCIMREECCLKDLRLLGCDLQTTILVDNSITSLVCNYDNGLLIQTWDGSINDRRLLEVLDVLIASKDVPDVRPFLRKLYNLENSVKECLSSNRSLPAQLPLGWNGSKFHIPIEPPAKELPLLIVRNFSPHFQAANYKYPKMLFQKPEVANEKIGNKPNQKGD
eukprot:Platyproteum_vivax@DN3880_c0_g1_i1.p1